jgi:prepilin-type processing-associated H-X9-DG protein
MAKRKGVPIWLLLLAVILVLAFYVALSVLGRAGESGPPLHPCLSHVKNISLAVQMYAADNDDHFPPAGEWCDVLDEYVKNRDVFQCPQARGGPGWNYAYNPLLSSRSMYDLADLANTVAIFESDAGRNAAGGPELLPDEPRHLGGDNYGFADGHASWLKRKSAGEDRRGERIWLKEPVKPVRWEP